MAVAEPMSQFKCPHNYVLQSLTIAYTLANSACPDEMQRFVAFCLGCLNTHLGVSSLQRIKLIYFPIMHILTDFNNATLG